MAVCIRMLRFARLYAGSPGVLGARAVLSPGWLEARLQGVRPLRYWARERDGGGPVLRKGPAELCWGPIPFGLGGRQLLNLWMALGGVGTPHLAPRRQEILAYPAQIGARLVVCSGPALTLDSGQGPYSLTFVGMQTARKCGPLAV